jgi:hypothetical protein
VKIFLLCLLIASCANGFAQPCFKDRHSFGIKLGLVESKITGGRVKTHSKGAFTGGLWLQLKMNKHWTARSEIIFIEKGTGGINHNRPRLGDYWVGLFYFEFPVLFQYHWKKLSLEFGPGLGALTYGHEILHGAPSPDMSEIYPFTNKELSFNAGIGYSPGKKKWELGLRFTHSLLPVRKQIPDISQEVYSRVFTLALSRRLNVKKSENGETQTDE